MLAGFRHRLVGKPLMNVFHREHTDMHALCWQAGDHTHICINQRIELY